MRKMMRRAMSKKFMIYLLIATLVGAHYRFARLHLHPPKYFAVPPSSPFAHHSLHACQCSAQPHKCCHTLLYQHEHVYFVLPTAMISLLLYATYSNKSHR